MKMVCLTQYRLTGHLRHRSRRWAPTGQSDTHHANLSTQGLPEYFSMTDLLMYISDSQQWTATGITSATNEVEQYMISNYPKRPKKYECRLRILNRPHCTLFGQSAITQCVMRWNVYTAADDSFATSGNTMMHLITKYWWKRQKQNA